MDSRSTRNAGRDDASAAQATPQPPLAKLAAPGKPVTPGTALTPARGNFGKSLVNYLFPAFVLWIACGYGLLYSGVCSISGNELSSDRSLFHAVNAATLSGFQMALGVREMNLVGRSCIGLLMAGGILFSLVVGGLAMVRILRLPYSDRRVIAASIVALLGAAALGTIGGVVSGYGFGESLYLAISAFGNGGAVLERSPGAAEAITHLVLLPLAVLGGLGITVLLELVERLRGRTRLSRHAWVVLVGLAGVYVGGFVVLLVLRWPGEAASAERWREVLISCAAMSINSRTLGLPLEWATYLSRPVQWVLMVLMTIGAASAGTAGGLKVNTIAELFRGTTRILRGQPATRGFGIAIVWTGVYFGIVLIAMLLLLHHVSEIPADRALFLTISAVSNTGLSHDQLSIVGDGLYTLTATMFAGRVVPLLILWWMADTTTNADVAVG